MRNVAIESPFAGDVDRNLKYVRECMADCLRRGEAPFASHALYTQPGVLDDSDPVERERGIEAGLSLATRCNATVVYTDFGITEGMYQGIIRAQQRHRPIEYRTLYPKEEIDAPDNT